MIAASGLQDTGLGFIGLGHELLYSLDGLAARFLQARLLMQT